LNGGGQSVRVNHGGQFKETRLTASWAETILIGAILGGQATGNDPAAREHGKNRPFAVQGLKYGKNGA
jgi:hypothetical protein